MSKITLLFAAWALCASAYIIYENPNIGLQRPLVCQFKNIPGKYLVNKRAVRAEGSMIIVTGADQRVHAFPRAQLAVCEQG